MRTKLWRKKSAVADSASGVMECQLHRFDERRQTVARTLPAQFNRQTQAVRRRHHVVGLAVPQKRQPPAETDDVVPAADSVWRLNCAGRCGQPSDVASSNR